MKVRRNLLWKGWLWKYGVYRTVMNGAHLWLKKKGVMSVSVKGTETRSVVEKNDSECVRRDKIKRETGRKGR